MPFLTVVLLFAGYSLADGLSMTAAQSSSFQEADGTTATPSPLGGNEAIYSNTHADKGPHSEGPGSLRIASAPPRRPASHRHPI